MSDPLVSDALEVVAGKDDLGQPNPGVDSRDVVQPTRGSSGSGSTGGGQTVAPLSIPVHPRGGGPVLKPADSGESSETMDEADAAERARRNKRRRALAGSIGGLFLLL